MTLYIYRVGRTCPAKNSFYRSKPMKNSNYTQILGGPVGPTGRPVGVAGPATRPTVQTAREHQSDRSNYPVPILVINICPSIFLVMLECQKISLWTKIV